MSDPVSPAGPRRAALIFIFITVVLDVLSFGVIIPVLPRLIERFLGGDTAHAAEWNGLFSTTWALMGFFCAPIFGALSDRFGRRPVILASNFAYGLDFLFMALAPTLPWLFVGRVISGITGSSFTAAYAYIADVTTPEKRSAGFGMVGAAFGLGFVIGPAVGGILGSIDLRLPFYVAAGLALVNACYGLFVLPESLPLERRSAFSWKKANPLGALKLLRSHPQLLGLSVTYGLYFLAHAVFPAIFVLYAGYRYGWNERDVGFALAAVGVCSALVQGGLVRKVVPKFGERRAMLFGLACAGLAYFLIGSAQTGFVVMIGSVISCLAGFFGPSVQGLMTKRVGPDEQGGLQGANTCVASIMGLIGPGLFSITFAEFIGPAALAPLPGTPFYVATGIVVLAAILGERSSRAANA